MGQANLSVGVSADVADLQAKMAIAKAELASFDAQVRSSAKSYVSASDDMKSAALAQVQSAVSGANGAKVAVASLASQVTQSTGTMHGSISVATREFRALFDELSSGRVRQSPGTLALIANRVFGISGSTLAAGAGVLALSAGLAYLIYEAIAAQKELEQLAAGAQLVGRNTEFATQFIAAQRDALASMSGVSGATANEIIALEASQTRLSQAEIAQINQVVPAYVKGYGKDAPEAVKKLVTGLAELSTATLPKLDNETLHLTSAQFESVQALLKTGDTAGALTQILTVLGQRGGIGIQTLDQQIAVLEKQIATIEEPAAILVRSMDESGHSAVKAADEVASLTRQIEALKQASANATGGAADAMAKADAQYKAQLQEAQALNNSLDRRGAIIRELTRLQAAYSEAQKRGDTAGAGTFQSAIGNEQKELADYDQRANKENVRDSRQAAQEAMADARAQTDEAVRGSQERIEAAKREVALAAQLYKEGSTQYIAAQRRETEAEQEAVALQRQIALIGAEAQRKVREEDLDAEMEEVKGRYEAHQISSDQEIAQLSNLTRQRWALEEAEYNAEAELAAQEPQRLAEINAKILEGRAALERQLAQIRAQGARDAAQQATREQQAYMQAFDRIGSTFESTVGELITGSMTWQRAEARVAQTVVTSFVEMGAHELASWAALELAKTSATAAGAATRQAVETAQAAGGTGISTLLMHWIGLETAKTLETTGQAGVRATADSGGGFVSELGNILSQWLGLETAKSLATTAGAAARATDEGTAAAAGLTTVGAIARAEIAAAAAVAAAWAFADTAALGPEALPGAPAAAAGAELAVMAFQGLVPALEVGAWDVPSNMLAQIHPGEMVVPQTFAEGMRSSGGGGAGQPITLNVNLGVQAIDSASFGATINRHARILATAISNQMSINPSLRPNF